MRDVDSGEPAGVSHRTERIGSRQCISPRPGFARWRGFLFSRRSVLPLPFPPPNGAHRGAEGRRHRGSAGLAPAPNGAGPDLPNNRVGPGGFRREASDSSSVPAILYHPALHPYWYGGAPSPRPRFLPEDGMAQPASRLQHLFRELKRRRVFRVVAVYAVAGWVVVQVAETVAEPLYLPDWTTTLVLVLVLLGFPFAVSLAGLAMPHGGRRGAGGDGRAAPAGPRRGAADRVLDARRPGPPAPARPPGL